MRQIRMNVFETNSSSVHSLTIVSKEEYEKFAKGEMIIFDDELMEMETALKKAQESKWYAEMSYDELIEERVFKTLDDLGGEYYETFTQHYTTKNGDEIVAFGYYGHD